MIGDILNRGLLNFIIAVILIVIITAGGVFGIAQLIKYYPDKIPWVSGDKSSGAVLPDDVALYKGSVLTDSTVRGGRLTFKYTLPLGAQSTVREYYEKEMPGMGWQRLAGDEEYLAFYKREGKRRTIIRIIYEDGKAAVSIEITGNNNKD